MAAAVLQLAELGLHGAAFLCGVVCAAALTVAQVPAWGVAAWGTPPAWPLPVPRRGM